MGLKPNQDLEDTIDEQLEQRIYYAVSKEIDHREIMKEIKQVFSNLLAEQKTIMTKPNQDWEKELKENFFGLVQQDRIHLTEWNKLKQFISNLLSNQKEQSYEEGFIAGADSTAIQAEEIEAIKREEAKQELLDKVVLEEKKIGRPKNEDEQGDWLVIKEGIIGYNRAIRDLAQIKNKIKEE